MFNDSKKELAFIIINYLNETEDNFDDLVNKVSNVVETFESTELTKFSPTFDFSTLLSSDNNLDVEKIMKSDLEEYLKKYSEIYFNEL